MNALLCEPSLFCVKGMAQRVEKVSSASPLKGQCHQLKVRFFASPERGGFFVGKMLPSLLLCGISLPLLTEINFPKKAVSKGGSLGRRCAAPPFLPPPL